MSSWPLMKYSECCRMMMSSKFVFMEYFKVVHVNYFSNNYFYEVLQPFFEVLPIKEWEMDIFH